MVVIQPTRAEKEILETMRIEFFPQFGEIKDLLVELQQIRVGFGVFNRNLRSAEIRHAELLPKFFQTVVKLQTPDKLFESLNTKQNDSEPIMAYMNIKT